MKEAPETILEVLREYGEAEGDTTLLAELAREVGFRLAVDRGNDLSRLRAALAEAESACAGADRLCEGTLLALHEVVSAYATERRNVVERQGLAAHWRSGDTLRSSLIQALDRGPERPSRLARRLGTDPPQLSRSAAKLESEGLIDKVPVRDDARGTWYRLTPEGARIASVLRGEDHGSHGVAARSFKRKKTVGRRRNQKKKTASPPARSGARLRTVFRGERAISHQDAALAEAED